MNPDREELLFALALTKPAAERAGWLDRECAGDSARRRAYASDMNLAKQAVDANNFGRAMELLNRHRPNRGSKAMEGYRYGTW